MSITQNPITSSRPTAMKSTVAARRSPDKQVSGTINAAESTASDPNANK